MARHALTADILDGQITDLVSDGSDLMYLHLDNGVVLSIVAAMHDGMPFLQILRATDIVLRPIH